MKIGIVKEILEGECRVAAIPETVAKMKSQNMEVWIESNAGYKAGFKDKAYQSVGATITSNAESIYKQVDILIKVHPPINDKDLHEVDHFKQGLILICPLYLKAHPDLSSLLEKKQTTVFALDLLPRIARAQSMDILSSMSNLAGYKSVILAADHLKTIFPMLTTAAGTTQPARVLVIGAGVAGLQAIATARRLGGIVKSMDTRPVAEEQVKSLGAEFVSLKTEHAETEDSGGYAKEQSAAFYKNEQDIIGKHLSDIDVVITTALIPGKPAPLLITDQMVQSMKPGSVIVDLAIEQGGNCQLSEKGKIKTVNDVTIIALTHIPSTLATNASQLYAKNMLSFLNYVVPQIKNHEYDMTDEIIKNCLVMKNGEVIRH